MPIYRLFSIFANHRSRFDLRKQLHNHLSDMDFKITSRFAPTGDQPQAIKSLTEGIRQGDKAQVLLGVTGSGKTFTMANVIANI